ncbi:[protein-PII] uridylyltransferase [Umboniibacter marinipuniceus]|uniref:Bifunctional uridylyltransferase/uridylyl-removing enzyme n=1 Tax=Umboniibacter marinipuniceus TaxID=569599 RepID=A0A3M0A1K2_9GAMM|nr:[protein-PII] uridylyltransferase [Umboniibacter marinipuniceus]RMA78670.1 UTP--GlnB (protein PII) uridylyltransferase GlnD [Umboniibacter marinipuniceus]
MPANAPAPEFFDTNEFEQSFVTTPIISCYKQAIQTANNELDHRFVEGESIRSLVAERSDFFDYLLTHLWNRFIPTTAELELIAVGGYGRGELHPQSDLDILILVGDTNPEIDDQLSAYVTALWDLGLKIGHAVRSVEQAIALARKDLTVMTNIIESRGLAGNGELLEALVGQTRTEEMWNAQDYFNAKIEEQEIRHERNNNTEYNLEPNVKTAPGGLRDIQTIAWVAKRSFGAGDLPSLHKMGFLTDTEFSLLRNGETFLWRVRYGIHMLSKRPEERLQVDAQRQLADIFGYSDNPKALGVEQFMRRYYRWVATLSQLNEVLLQYLRESILGESPDSAPKTINRRFNTVDGYIQTSNTTIFARYPSAMLEIFDLMGDDPDIKGIRASTIRQLRAHLHLIDRRYRADLRNTSLFMEIMRSPYNLSRILKWMSEYGVLGAYLPEWDKITGLMQHDLFHRYTVDAHTLILVKHLRMFHQGLRSDDFPVATRVARKLPKPELLFIAGLFHDIAKGRGGNHAQLGAIDARNFCERHHLGAWDTNLVSWLIDKHLLMSGVSQKQDLSDPDVINRFAEKVGDQTYLDYLFCLTVADINATNPELWNSWKALLLRQLYHQTSAALARGAENPTNAIMWIADTKAGALAILKKDGYRIEDVEQLWSAYHDDYFLRENTADVAWHTRLTLDHNSDEPLVSVKDTRDSQAISATQIFVRTVDHPRVFAAITKALYRLNLSVYDARIHSLDDGFTADTFIVLDNNKETVAHDAAKVARIIEVITHDLTYINVVADSPSSKTSRLDQYFHRKTKASISTEPSERYSVLHVVTSDTPGLLARLATVLNRHDINLHFARTLTMGEKVEDTFHLTTAEGVPISNEDDINSLIDDIETSIDELHE